MDKRGRAAQVGGMDLEVEKMKVVVQDQVKASAPLPALVEPDAIHPLDLNLNS